MTPCSSCKVFGIGEGPDMFIAAHEWVCAFQQDGFVLKLDDYIAKYPDQFGTIFPSLWNATKCPDGGHYAIPQDAEARMFFYNKELLRKAGYDDAFIEGMPDSGAKRRADDGRPARHRQEGGRQDRRQIRHPASPVARDRTTSWCSSPTATPSSTRRPAT